MSKSSAQELAGPALRSAVRRNTALLAAALAVNSATLQLAAAIASITFVEVTGVEALDPVTALVVAAAIVLAGLRILSRSSRVLVDEALPEAELRAVGQAIADHGAPEVSGFHKLRARRAGSRRHIDLHVQFRTGTTLERAHAVTHELAREIRARIRDADVLIHLEPESRAREREGRGGGSVSGD